MKPFTDSQGRTWNVTINVSAIKRVRDVLAVDLLDVANGDLLSRLADDPCVLVDVLYVLCKPDADAKGVTDEDFGRGMVGGALDEASSALMKELLDFFPSALRARALAKMVRKMGEQQAAATEAVAALKPLAEAEAAVETPGDSSGNSPASAASTPAT
jgi:hypothetical protein